MQQTFFIVVACSIYCLIYIVTNMLEQDNELAIKRTLSACLLLLALIYCAYYYIITIDEQGAKWVFSSH